MAVTPTSLVQLFMGGMTALAVTGAAQAAADPQISEIRVDHGGAGTDKQEFFELSGEPGTDLSAYSYVVIGDGAAVHGSGVVEAVIDLTGVTIPAEGYLVVAEATFTLGDAFVERALNFENSDNTTHFLVRRDGGEVTFDPDLDPDDSGALRWPDGVVPVDCVALQDDLDEGELTYCDVIVGPDGTFQPPHVYRCPTGAAWRIGAFNLDDPSLADTPGGPPICPRQHEILTSHASVEMLEGGQVAVTVALSRRPTHDVVVPIHDADALTVEPDELRFTPEGPLSQVFVVTAPDDTVFDGSSTVDWLVVGPATSADPAYHRVKGPNIAVRLDDDEGLVVTLVTAPVVEEGRADAIVELVLNAPPDDNATVDVSLWLGALAPAGTEVAAASPARLTFTQEDWDQPQQVTISAAQDAAPGPHGEVVVRFDADFGAVQQRREVVLKRLDDDLEFDISFVDSAAFYRDGVMGPGLWEGTEGRLLVRASAGGGRRVFHATSDNPLLASEVVHVGEAGETTFRVWAPDDRVDRGDVAWASLTISADGYWTQDTLTLAIVDDDEAGIHVAPAAGLVTDEAGGVAAFTVALQTEPVAPVVIDFASSDDGEGRVEAPHVVTFTPGDWWLARTVFVAGEPDEEDDNDTAYEVRGVSESGDAAYDGIELVAQLVNRDVPVDEPTFELLVDVTAVAPGDDCERGGQRISIGHDDGEDNATAADGVLQQAEVEQTAFICNGEEGPRGDTGEQGPPGDKGDKGDKGDQGETGPRGLQGVEGDKGDKGDKGDRGDKGDQGATGAQGEPGETGPMGLTGAAGDTGDRGPQGDPGAVGGNCSVEELEGVVTVTCPDGTSAAWSAAVTDSTGCRGAAGGAGVGWLMLLAFMALLARGRGGKRDVQSTRGAPWTSL